jgi:phosphoglycerate dehydrogenase-like enzyme
MNAHRVLLNIAPFSLSEADRRQIEAACPGAVIECAPPELRSEPDRLDGRLVDVLVTEQVPRDLRGWPRLRFVQGLAAGIDFLKGHPIWETDIIVATASGIHGVPMGQFATGALLMMVHRMTEVLAFKATRQWPNRLALACRSLRGLTAGIIGYGSIGRECARQLRALGMRIVCVNRDVINRSDDGFNAWPGTGDPDGTLPERWFTPSQLDEMLPMCDAIVVAAPRTPETEGMIGAAELARVKATCHIIVVSRGGIVDEAALATALHEGRVAGAVIDSFAKEPPPADHPLFDAPNVILSPHVSGVFDGYWPMALRLICENLKRFSEGRPVLNPANGRLGY